MGVGSCQVVDIVMASLTTMYKLVMTDLVLDCPMLQLPLVFVLVLVVLVVVVVVVIVVVVVVVVMV